MYLSNRNRRWNVNQSVRSWNKTEYCAIQTAWFIQSQEFSDTTVIWEDRGNCRLGFWGKLLRGIHATRDNSWGDLWYCASEFKGRYQLKTMRTVTRGVLLVQGNTCLYEDVSKSFRTGYLERDCKWYSSLPLGAVVSLFLSVSLVSFAATALYIASERVFIFVSIYFFIDSVRNLLDTPSYNAWEEYAYWIATIATLCVHSA